MATVHPNLVESKMLFSPPTETLLDTTIIAAIDTATSSTAISPNAYTATVSDFYDQRNVRIVNTAASLPAGNRIAFGLFLPGLKAKNNCIFSCFGASSLFTNASGLLAYYIFGRLNAAVPVVSTTTVENPLDYYIVLPSAISSMNSSSDNPNHHFCSEDIVDKQALTNVNPMFFGLVLENPKGTGINLLNLNCSLSFQRYVDDHMIFHPNR